MLGLALRLVGGTFSAVFLFATGALAQQHPLDPLTFQEHWTVLQVLQREGRLNGSTAFHNVSLLEPEKQQVWRFAPGASFARRAQAVVTHEGKTAEAVVDLRAESLESWKELGGVQPNWLGREFNAVVDEIKQHPEVVAALAKRGIRDLEFVDCTVIPPGYFGTDEQRGRRIGHAGCTYSPGVSNTWVREIAGLSIVVDLEQSAVVRVVDEGAVPIPETTADYDAASIGPPRDVPGPIRIEQPYGSGFELHGNVVAWQKWRFHVRSEQRVGPVISTVSYEDGGEARPVLYQGYLSDIYVPYMDPSFTWAHRTFLDSGEFFAGGLTKPLQHGVDCPGHARYLNGLIANDVGRPERRDSVICIFEREAGDMAWRHLGGGHDGRRKRDLVVRSAAVLGNYDYVLDWAFQQDGTIRVSVGSTGQAQVKIVDGAIAGDNADDQYGRFVDRHVVAVNHDHYFNFRLDLDVDGPVNRFVVDRLVTRELPPESPRRSIWVQEPVFPAKESAAKLNAGHGNAALWRVTSASRRNAVGYPTSYQLAGGMLAATLLSGDDHARRRAAFIEHDLWVTPYAADERFAAGDYPTLGEPGMGLPAWTAADRSVQNADIVLWHTIGMHHVVRAEDWPVMPVMWQSFELRPFDFFDRNPALDLPQ